MTDRWVEEVKFWGKVQVQLSPGIWNMKEAMVIKFPGSLMKFSEQGFHDSIPRN